MMLVDMDQKPAQLSGEEYSNRELVEAFIGKRLTENLAAFEKYLPDIFKEFENYSERRYYLIYDEFGNINVFDSTEETALFSGNPVQQCLETLKEYKKSPIQRPYFISYNEPDNDMPDADEALLVESNAVNYVHSPSLNRIAGCQARVIKKMAQDTRDRIISSIKNKSDSKLSSSKVKLPGHVNMLIFISTGIGFDFEKLYLDSEVKRLILVEPDFDIFYISLQLIDWVSILEKSECHGYSLDIVLNDDIDQIPESINGAIARAGRHHMSGAFVYSGFYLDQYRELYKNIKGDIQYGHLSGFGFYDDSRYNFSHTVGNIVNNIPILCANRDINKSHGQKDIPVFIVGNGPSIDDEIDFLRANQSNAIIVSCGSALRTLIVNDIIPDMHAELERTAHVPYWIKNSAKGVDGFFDKLKKVHFVGASQVHPDAFSLFGKSGQLLKDTETGSMLAYNAFAGSGVPLVPRVAPSCVHIALSASVLLGYRKFFLFGVDMGSLDPEKHHSKDSMYYKLSDEDLKGQVFKTNGEIYESNFGEKEVYSSGIYPLFKRELEVIIKGWSHNFQEFIEFFNCSDGAMIKGAEPIRSSDIELNPVDKKPVFESSFSSLFSFYPADRLSDVMDLASETKEMVAKVCDWAISNIKPAGSLKEAIDQIDLFAAKFHSDEVLSDEFAWVYSVFDGSLLYSLSVMNTTIQLPVDEVDALDAFNDQLEELRRFFEVVKRDFTENCFEWDRESRYDMFSHEATT